VHPRRSPSGRASCVFTLHQETWRYRIGSWRFFYEIDDDERIVFMLAASHRSSAY